MLAREVTDERHRPLDLALAARFLPLVAAQQPDAYDGWAPRWLGRWLRETAGTVELAAELAGALADLATEPTAFEAVRDLIDRDR